LRVILHKWGGKDYTQVTYEQAKAEMTALGIIAEKLRGVGLRPTRQRMALAKILFGGGDWHVSAEALHREACAADVNVSVATVYNTLNQFTAAGLLREVAIEGDRSFFDTNTSNHFHFFHEKEGRLFDIGTDDLQINGLPAAPEGCEIDRIDVIVRLRKIST
jgi:Fur family transcriptional regulator, iron response regulator